METEIENFSISANLAGRRYSLDTLINLFQNTFDNTKLLKI